MTHDCNLSPFYASMAFISCQKATNKKFACDIAHLEQLSTSLVCDNRDFLRPFLLSRKFLTICIQYVNTICGTKLREMPKNKRTTIMRSDRRHLANCHMLQLHGQESMALGTTGLGVCHQ